MKIKASVLLNVLLATILLSLILFSANTAKTGSGSEYDPWIDYNDDGKIDHKDLLQLAAVYGTSGTPINKTALLLDLLARVESLEDRVEALEKKTGLPPPDYDSGWVKKDIGGEEFVHNLGTTEVLVYIVGRSPSPEVGIHQHCYGGDYCKDYTYPARGLFWSLLTPNSIWVVRQFDDYSWSEVRVMIWKIQPLP